MKIILVVFLVYVVISSISGYVEINRLKDKDIIEKIKIKLYKITILEGWLITSITLSITMITKLPLRELGLSVPNTNDFEITHRIRIACIIACSLLLLLLLYQMMGYLTSEAYRARLRSQLEKSEAKSSHYDKILTNIMLPKTYREKQWFTFVSATAGIGEEIVYRGFLMYHLMQQFSKLPLLLILLIASIIFGLAHSYQGLTGMLKTSLVGMVLGALYITSGSILPGIILHFIMDFSSNFLYPSIDNKAYTRA